MKAKKGICSSDCECLTITWWRCYAEEHLCNCGDWGSTPPVPPVPGFTYSLEKTSTRGAKDTYTASKYDNANTLVKAYSFSVEYNDNEGINSLKIWDCTWDCVWKEMDVWGDYDSFDFAYINKAENALTAWTQEAFKEVFEDYDILYNGEDGNIYWLTNGSESVGREWVNVILQYYIFHKWYWGDYGMQPDKSYALWLEYSEETWDLVAAGIDDSNGSFEFTDIPDSSQALALKAEYDSIIANISQAACKEWFEDAKTLYDSLQ